ncbi:acetyl-CoA acetyltransferase [Anaerosporomusa subterranea]|uniref:acetyl-CoA C-acetyltransferase n=1 Tax=Anaerosporomusa subterranea TaxID=1794912 RepID=A0A154BQN5_ANASB|nr:thiolase family protein [Anaerosporomusa subterranea]KYZ76262.1 acetyl-CoA acetyltransferase [Anaerosporomusa subterranea]
MKEVVIVSAVRTPIGSIGGTLKDVQPEVLVKTVIEGAIDKIGLDKALIDEIIIGQTKQTTDAPNIARVAALMARVPEEVPAYTVHRQCASGMQAITNGLQQIQTGYSDIVLVGGVESMSTAPFYIRNARFGVGSGNTAFIDPNIESQPKSQPKDIYGTFNMIQTADTVAKQFNVSREEQDEFALSSQQKAIAAIDSNRFADEIVPVILPQRKGDPIVFATDEYPKRSTSLEKLAKLKPIFTDGTVTAGNASGRNDGASALILMSKEKAEELGIKPLAKIIGAAATGVDPRVMGIGPVPATRKLLKKLDMKIEDFGLVEINEAFAAQSVACAKELNIDMNKLNVNGGAIALGHPLGCSGARISATLIYEMKKRQEKYGLATICIAGGLGMAIAFENLD